VTAVSHNPGDQRQGRSAGAIRFATAAVARIAGGRLVTIELGGHQFAGHDAVVGEAISAFVASAGPNSA
jgi:hypothetical protein